MSRPEGATHENRWGNSAIVNWYKLDCGAWLAWVHGRWKPSNITNPRFFSLLEPLPPN